MNTIIHEGIEHAKHPLGPYYISKCGRVVSTARGARRCLKTWTDPSGYIRVKLGAIRDSSYLVHRAMLEAWDGLSDLEVRHLDGDPSNCRYSNLEYGTRRENMLDARRQGRINVQKLDRNQVVQVREQYARGKTQSALATQFGVTRSCIQDIVNGRTWTDVGGPTHTAAIGGWDRRKP